MNKIPKTTWNKHGTEKIEKGEKKHYLCLDRKWLVNAPPFSFHFNSALEVVRFAYAIVESTQFDMALDDADCVRA
jgi:hypothetical protein